MKKLLRKIFEYRVPLLSLPMLAVGVAWFLGFDLGFSWWRYTVVTELTPAEFVNTKMGILAGCGAMVTVNIAFRRARAVERQVDAIAKGQEDDRVRFGQQVTGQEQARQDERFKNESGRQAQAKAMAAWNGRALRTPARACAIAARGTPARDLPIRPDTTPTRSL